MKHLLRLPTTAGFTLPMIQRLANGRAKARMPRSLILEPTRELAAQVAEEISGLAKYKSISCQAIYGGASMQNQLSAIRADGQDEQIALHNGINQILPILRLWIQWSEYRLAKIRVELIQHRCTQ